MYSRQWYTNGKTRSRQGKIARAVNQSREVQLIRRAVEDVKGELNCNQRSRFDQGCFASYFLKSNQHDFEVVFRKDFVPTFTGGSIKESGTLRRDLIRKEVQKSILYR